MSKSNWIQKALPPESKGKLHEKLGIKEGKKIPAKLLKSKEHAKGALGKEVRLAETLKDLNKGKK